MSDELTKKLKEIQRTLISQGGGLDDYGRDEGEENKTADASVEQIKQAFIDDGWTKVDKRLYRDEHGRRYQQYTFSGGYVRVPEFQQMTAQEFYDRSIDEYAKSRDSIDAPDDYAMEAAMKASGIES